MRIDFGPGPVNDPPAVKIGHSGQDADRHDVALR